MLLLDLLLPILGVVLDQLTKYFAVTRLQGNGSVSLIPGVFQLTYCENAGAAFSLFSGKRWLLALISAVMLAALIFALRKNLMAAGVGRWGLRLVIAGAAGNLIDRVLYGYVVDFFDFRLINFPIFNVADVLLNIGVVLMLIDILFLEPKRDKKEKNGGNTADHSGN